MGIRTITPEREVSRGEIAAPGGSNVGGGAGGGGRLPMNPYLGVPDARKMRLETLRPIGDALRARSLAVDGNEIIAKMRANLSEMSDGISDGEGVKPWTDVQGVAHPGLNAAFDNDGVSSDDLDKALAHAHTDARQKLEKLLRGKSQAVRDFVHEQVDGDIENWRARFEERAITRRMKENVARAGATVDADAGAIGASAIADLVNDKAQSVDIVAAGGDPVQIEAARKEKVKAVALDFANRSIIERQRAVGNLIVQSGGLMSQQEAERRVGAIYDRRAQEMISNLARSGNYDEAKAFISVGHLMGYSEETKQRAMEAVNGLIVNDAKSRISTATADEEVTEAVGSVEAADVGDRLYREIRELGDRKLESLAEFRRREETKAVNDSFDQRELDVFAPREDGSVSDPAMWGDALKEWSQDENLRRVNPRRALAYANQATELKEAADARRAKEAKRQIAAALTPSEVKAVIAKAKADGTDALTIRELEDLGERKRKSLDELRKREEYAAASDDYTRRELALLAPLSGGGTVDPMTVADSFDAWSRDEDLRRIDPKRAMSYADRAKEIRGASAAAQRKNDLDAVHKSIILLDVLRNPSPYDPPMTDEARTIRIREVQDAAARKMRLMLLNSTITPSEYDSLYSRFNRELNAQQKMAMQMFYREMGVSSSSLAMTDNGALTSAGVNDLRSVRYYETDGYGEDGGRTAEFGASQLLQIGDSLLKTLGALGDDVYKPEVVKKAVADAKIAFVKGNSFDTFRDSLLKNVETIRLNDLAAKTKRTATKETKTNEQ